MRVIDRYVLMLYVRWLVIAVISLSGLYIVIDGLGNLDEFVSYGKKHDGGILYVLFDYYSPRFFQFVDRTSGMLAMVAAIFAMTLMQRNNELTALMAAGISTSRVIRPLIVATIVVAGLSVANRELYLPQVRDKLSRNAQDWLGENARRCTPKYDIRTDILISGQQTYAKDKQIESPLFRLPPELSAWGRQISAARAFYKTAENGRPAGYLLQGVTQPAGLAELKTASFKGAPVLFAPSDTPGLQPTECFVASVITFEQLALGNSWRQQLSTQELIFGLADESIEPGADVRVTLHSRIVQPLLDLTLLFLGLPLVLTRGNRNIFVATGICFALVATFFVVTLCSHALGSNYLLDPVLAAWGPLLVFGPLAYTLSRPLWD